MNAKKFLIPLVLLVGLIVLTSPATFARPWYVDNSAIGNDGRDGSSPTIPNPDDFVTGPKKTLGGTIPSPGAIAAAIAGDTIFVANTGVAYSVATGEPATIIVNKKLTIRSTGGSVSISSLVEVNNASASPDNTVIFDSGAFTLSGGLTLTVGVLTNSADLLTVGGTITRSIAAATVGSQLKYTGTVNFVYAGGAAITAGNEFPATGTFNNLTTTGAGTNLTLKATSASMTGVATTAGTLNLGGNVLTITNTGAATHVVGGGDVSNGTLAFSLGAAAATTVTINGAVAIPSITASTSNDNAQILAIAQPTSITGPLTVSGKASVTSSAALITVGAASFAGDEIVLSGTGNITLDGAPTTINGNIINSGTGNLQINGTTRTVNGNILLSTTGLKVSSTGWIVFGGSGAITVNGNVTNSAGVVLGAGATVTRAGVVWFPAVATTITGIVKIDGTLSGTAVATPAVDDYRENGLIYFGAVTDDVTLGTVINDSRMTATGIAGATVSTNGQIWFQSTTGNIIATGGFVNSSTMPKLALGTNANNGAIVTQVRTTGTIGTTGSRTGLISNTSVSDEPTNGQINFSATATGILYGTSISQGALGAGGDITFGDHAINITGNITNARTATGADITVPAGAATVTNSIGGYIMNSGKSNISIDLSGDDVAGITGRLENTGDGSITFPNAGTGAITIGGLVVSKGLVSIPATSNATLAINGAVNISGGEASLLGAGANTIVITGPASFTGGAFTTTGRATVTTNSTSITFGGASSNTTFSPAATTIIIGNPSPTSLVTVTIGTFNPTIAGALEVNNTTGLAEAVRFTGGSMTVTGNLSFTSGAIVIADNANISVVGTFTNTAGYTTPTIGRVTLAGTVAGQAFGGAGIFGNIEFKNDLGMATSSTVTIAGTVYLTSGDVANTGGAITINNATVLPTVVLNAGKFLQTPTYDSNVNITYIGSDKTTGSEIPASATRLQNLTVATTNGASAGKGIVKLSANLTVNGILTVNALQALNIDNTFTLTMKGASIVLNGDIINVGTGKLSLAAATGTTIAGAGYLPPTEIAAASVGNVIGAKAIIYELLGTDGIYLGAADFAPTTGTAQGSLTFITGTNSATITLTGITDGSMVGAVTTASTGNTLNLGGNLVVAGALTHAAGTINVATFTLEQRGAGITLGTTPTAAFTGTGLLKFYQKDATTNTSFTLTSAGTAEGSLIGINTELNNADADGAEDNLTLAGGLLTISGSLTITDGELVLGQPLTLTGSAATITANGTITGAGVLTFNAGTPPLVFSFTGAPTISNLTIRNNVNLAGTGTGLTISTAFNHVAGILNFGDMNLTFQTAFTRTAGTAAYSAGTGYMILDGAAAMTIAQGTDGFSIPNLRITASAANNVSLTTAQGTVTVTKAFDLDCAAQTFTTNGKLAIADLSTVNYTSGAISAAPAYAGSITLVGKNYATGIAFPANLWPTTVNVTTLQVTNTTGANVISIPGARTVSDELLLTSGVLDLSAAAQVLTVSDSSTINVIAGRLTASAGSVVFGNNNDVNYKINAAYITGIELPSTVKNLTITRNSNVVNSAVTLNKTVTVNGALTIKNDVNIPVAPPSVVVTANGNVSIINDVASFNLATNPVCTFNQSMVFGGGNATLTVPDLVPPLNFGAITINKTAASNTLTLVGGNIATGIITFAMGDIVTGDNVLYIPAPTTGAVAGGAVSQGFIGAGPNSMVVGNVAKALINNGTINGSTEADNQFPVGTGLVYRPAILSFNANFGVPTTPNATIVVGHVDSNPGGDQALPIVDGVEAGVDIARYPAFYWSIYTIGNVSPSTEFDLGLTAGNFTDFDSPANVRIIRRHGAVADVNNDWLLQGTNTNYDNEVNAQTGFTAINRNSVAGLRTGGAVFTYGLKSRIVAQTLPDVTIGKVGSAWPAYKLPALSSYFSNYSGTLVFSISSTNTSVANGVVSNDTLIVTAIKLGDATITVKATDSNLDFTTSSFNVEATAVGVIVAPLPKVFALKQNYPNPFNPTTNISFDIPQNSSVKIVIYDMLGREVSTLVNANYAPGTYTVPFNASRLSSGMYIYRMTSQSVNGETFNSIKKLMLVK